MKISRQEQNQLYTPTMSRLLVLVPHRDARLEFQKWSAALFSAGMSDAYSFPCVAPIAALSEPLSHEELKTCALALRKLISNGNDSKPHDGKLHTEEAARLDLQNTDVLFGLKLNLNINDNFFNDCYGEKSRSNIFLHVFSPVLIGVCIKQTVCQKPGSDPDNPQLFFEKNNDTLPRISFRAAALANMSIRAIDGFSPGSYEWIIKKPCWLPSSP